MKEVDGRAACLAMSKDPAAKVTLLLFPPGNKRPAYVVKVPTTDAAAVSIEREAGVLAEIACRNLGPLRNTVPRIVTTAEHDGRPVLVTSALPGRTMLASYHTWRHTARPAAVGADFAAASRWLSELQHGTARGDIDMASMLDGVAAAIGRRFGDRPDAAADLAAIDALQDDLAGHRLPRTFVHGDFWPGNLLVAAGGRVAGVIDWESGRPEGPPTRDVARFVVAYSL
jgi:aminoglycoside phosphotransferase